MVDAAHALAPVRARDPHLVATFSNRCYVRLSKGALLVGHASLKYASAKMLPGFGRINGTCVERLGALRFR
ncbi:hypothetical protein HDG34_006123 [Paraburkholderia sp. HC6.4b]|nr:hypothetical protein [Paraburkholderia sp. HC6.4b]MBB5454219.1 hypothetical protein [Paraburkholderia sp. Kb1A]